MQTLASARPVGLPAMHMLVIMSTFMPLRMSTRTSTRMSTRMSTHRSASQPFTGWHGHRGVWVWSGSPLEAQYGGQPQTLPRMGEWDEFPNEATPDEAKFRCSVGH